MFDAGGVRHESAPRTGDGPARRRIAVIGSGIAGLSAAWLASKKHDVTLFEASSRIGGHAHTVTVPAAQTGDRSVDVDAGFMVLNERTYPNLLGMFAHLGVATIPSDMSFGVSLPASNLEYAGSPDPRRLFAQPQNLARPAFLRMLMDIKRFYRSFRADSVLALLDDVTLGDYLVAGNYSRAFIDWHILPMAGAIWSSSARSILDFPARTFANFFRNHGLLDFVGRPQWLTVAKRSQHYVEAIVADFDGTIRCDEHIQSVRRVDHAVQVKPKASQAERFDEVVFATHADVALRLLGDATPDEQAILGAFPFQTNRTFVHLDERLMPRRRNVWSSWNVVGGSERDSNALAVTYWLNRLQSLDTKAPIFVSLNPPIEPDEDRIVAQIEFRHPQFDLAAIRAQARLAAIQGQQHTWFAGAWCGYGFHEDGLNAGMAVAAGLGVTAPWQQENASGAPAHALA